MKKIILSALAALFTLSSSAQKTEVQMATLQHENQTSVFYGEQAFKDAYNAAADTLDVITLSSGTFSVPSQISKSITVYGTGYQTDAETGTKATILDGYLTFIPADMINDYGETVIGGKHVNGIHLEGLNISSSIILENRGNVPIYNLTIVKCMTQVIHFKTNSYNTTIRQSVIKSSIAGNSNRNAENMVIENCHLSRIYDFPYPSTIHINHCISTLRKTGFYNGPYYYTNNILYNTLPSTATAYNNIFVGQSGIGGNVFGANNWTGVADEGVYVADGEDGSWGENKDYMIKYPLKYVGNDNTVVGLHGGNYPWNKIPGIPRIISSEIDTKTSTEGMLKVSIQAEVQTME